MARLLISRQGNVNRQAWYIHGLDPHDNHDDFQAWPLIASGGVQVGELRVSIVRRFASHLTMMASSFDMSICHVQAGTGITDGFGMIRHDVGAVRLQLWLFALG